MEKLTKRHLAQDFARRGEMNLLLAHGTYDAMYFQDLFTVPPNQIIIMIGAPGLYLPQDTIDTHFYQIFTKYENIKKLVYNEQIPDLKLPYYLQSIWGEGSGSKKGLRVYGPGEMVPNLKLQAYDPPWPKNPTELARIREKLAEDPERRGDTTIWKRWPGMGIHKLPLTNPLGYEVFQEDFTSRTNHRTFIAATGRDAPHVNGYLYEKDFPLSHFVDGRGILFVVACRAISNAPRMFTFVGGIPRATNWTAVDRPIERRIQYINESQKTHARKRGDEKESPRKRTRHDVTHEKIANALRTVANRRRHEEHEAHEATPMNVNEIQPNYDTLLREYTRDTSKASRENMIHRYGSNYEGKSNDAGKQTDTEKQTDAGKQADTGRSNDISNQVDDLVRREPTLTRNQAIALVLKRLGKRPAIR